jgi:guanosine-3',5'-bis(diphosphate) 3'-pyrophosphohydrolase
MNKNDSQLTIEAVMFAAYKHRNQRRKDADASPYINHPIALAHVLSTIGEIEDLNVICAALLHDTIEDTDTTYFELEQQFGSKIASIVLEVSDDKSLSKSERKQLQIDHAADISFEAKLVKLADKICNLRDILTSPPSDWKLELKVGYFDWANNVVAKLKGTNANLEAEFDNLYLKKIEL